MGAACAHGSYVAATLYVDGQKVHTLMLVPASSGGVVAATTSDTHTAATLYVDGHKVVAATTSDTHTAATLYVDGQKIHTLVLVPASAGGNGRAAFKGIPAGAAEERELLFSLPRFVSRREKQRNGGQSLPKEKLEQIGTIRGYLTFVAAAEERGLPFSLPCFVSRREKQRNGGQSLPKEKLEQIGDHQRRKKQLNGGQSLPKEKLEQIGIIRVTFAPTRYGRIETQPANYRIDEGFVQANKKDCAVKGMGQGDDGQMWTYYCDPQVVGPIVDMAVHYRTQHYLIEHRIIANPHAEEARAEKDKKRAARRKRDHGSQGGGAPADAALSAAAAITAQQDARAVGSLSGRALCEAAPAIHAL
ncbi:hypothetical protein JKP88DRAFT_353788 [Tribonema minus]|uniref:Uncharacterized protein n=1 Tax=Tribonema minus TaxID=303371 RepID=A0A836CIC1_9STRA|nr:hypothetical protein JKP88DRAFT_353788 [Tribonema minus]